MKTREENEDDLVSDSCALRNAWNRTRSTVTTPSRSGVTRGRDGRRQRAKGGRKMEGEKYRGKGARKGGTRKNGEK